MEEPASKMRGEVSPPGNGTANLSLELAKEILADLANCIHNVFALHAICQMAFSESAEPPRQRPGIGEIATKYVKDPIGTPLNATITQDHRKTSDVLLILTCSLQVESGNLRPRMWFGIMICW